MKIYTFYLKEYSRNYVQQAKSQLDALRIILAESPFTDEYLELIGVDWRKHA